MTVSFGLFAPPYGNGPTLSLNFNARMQLKTFVIKKFYQNQWYENVHVENSYYPNGEPKYARDFVADGSTEHTVLIRLAECAMVIAVLKQMLSWEKRRTPLISLINKATNTHLPMT